MQGPEALRENGKSTTPSSPTSARTPWAWALGTAFGIGLVGKGGGTVASIATAAVWFAVAKYWQAPLAQVTLATLCAALAVTMVGIPAGTIVARELGKKDPSEVVVDEVAGQLIALIAAPVHPINWKYVLVSLILFRAFDIVKPPPVRQLERLPRGLGIMMDDVAAGIYALAIVQCAYRFLPFFAAG